MSTVRVADGTARIGDTLYWQDRDWPLYDDELDDPNRGLHWGPLEDVYTQFGDVEVGIRQDNPPFGNRILGRLLAKECYLNPNNMP